MALDDIKVWVVLEGRADVAEALRKVILWQTMDGRQHGAEG